MKFHINVRVHNCLKFCLILIDYVLQKLTAINKSKDDQFDHKFKKCLSK